jgi:hypothetical protein
MGGWNVILQGGEIALFLFVPEKIDSDELVEAAGTRARISSLGEPPGAGNDTLGVRPFYHC